MAATNTNSTNDKGNGARVSTYSRAARRHLRQTCAVEEQLRTLLDEIPYVTISGDSCIELNSALPHLRKAVALLSSVERRESVRYAALTEGC